MQPADRDQVLDAIRDFHAERGRLPLWSEWEHATPDRPCARTIERRWGWRNVMAEAVGVDADGLELWEGWSMSGPGGTRHLKEVANGHRRPNEAIPQSLPNSMGLGRRRPHGGGQAESGRKVVSR
jgi:hypothetical protein